MKVEIEIESKFIPDGYEAVAFRVPVPGDAIISSEGGYLEVFNGFQTPRLILRKLPPSEPIWRAWKDRSEIDAASLRYIAWHCAPKPPGPRTYWWTVTGIGEKHVRLIEQDRTFEELFYADCMYSADGVVWNRCGVLKSGQ